MTRGYDNATDIHGKHKRLQQQIIKKIYKTFYIPCLFKLNRKHATTFLASVLELIENDPRKGKFEAIFEKMMQKSS